MDLIGKVGGTPDFSTYSPGRHLRRRLAHRRDLVPDHGRGRLLPHRGALHQGQGALLPEPASRARPRTSSCSRRSATCSPRSARTGDTSSPPPRAGAARPPQPWCGGTCACSQRLAGVLAGVAAACLGVALVAAWSPAARRRRPRPAGGGAPSRSPVAVTRRARVRQRLRRPALLAAAEPVAAGRRSTAGRRARRSSLGRACSTPGTLPAVIDVGGEALGERLVVDDLLPHLLGLGGPHQAVGVRGVDGVRASVTNWILSRPMSRNSRPSWPIFDEVRRGSVDGQRLGGGVEEARPAGRVGPACRRRRPGGPSRR